MTYQPEVAKPFLTELKDLLEKHGVEIVLEDDIYGSSYICVEARTKDEDGNDHYGYVDFVSYINVETIKDVLEK